MKPSLLNPHIEAYFLFQRKEMDSLKEQVLNMDSKEKYLWLRLMRKVENNAVKGAELKALESRL